MTSKFILMCFSVILILHLPSISTAGIIKETWYMSRGKANMNIKNYKAAIEAFEQLVAIDPDNQEAMQLLGQAYERQGLIQKAIDHYDRYLKRFPEDADIAFKQAHFLEDARFAYRRADAIKYYRLGLAHKEHFKNQHNLARLLSGNKQTIDQALIEYRQLIETDPDNPDIYAEYRTLLLWDEKYLSEAIKAFETTVEKHPDHRKYNHQLAKLYFRHPRYVKEAITQYQKLVESHPEDKTLRKQYAKALAQSASHFDEAKKQFEIALAQKEHFATRLAYADHLAKQKSTRSQALEQYKQLVFKKPADIPIRLKYSKLLSGDKEDLDAAIKQYQMVVKYQPQNAEAHKGLAHCFAWKGDNDMAIYHSRLALDSKPREKSTLSLKQDLMQGREPRLNANINFFRQVGKEKDFDLNAWIFKTGFKADLTPFLTGYFEAGHEKFWEQDQSIHGNTFKCDFSYRLNPAQKIDTFFGHHALNGTDTANEMGLSYTFEHATIQITPGFTRFIKADSLLSIGGKTDPRTRTNMGAARQDQLFCKFLKTNDHFEMSATPFIGLIKANRAGKNLTLGTELRLEYQIKETDLVTISVIDDLQMSHYAEDHSGFKMTRQGPLPGGYYSPQFLVSNALDLAFEFNLKDKGTLTLSAGPSVAYSKEHTDSKDVDAGADAHLTYLKQIKESWFVQGAADYVQIADTYHRLTLSFLVNYKF